VKNPADVIIGGMIFYLGIYCISELIHIIAEIIEAVDRNEHDDHVNNTRLAADAVTLACLFQTGADSIVINEAVDSAGNGSEQHGYNIVLCGLSIAFADLIDIVNILVQENDAVDAAGYDGEQ